MNTLSKHHTRKFFASQSEYEAFRQHWAKLVNDPVRKHELKAVHHLLYLVLCGKDWRRAFTYPTDANKLNNGYEPAIYPALRRIRRRDLDATTLALFDGYVQREAMDEVRKYLEHLPRLYPLIWDDEGNYRVEAYCLPRGEEPRA